MYESKGIGIIQEPLAYYRWHGQNRTFAARGLGLDLHKKFIQEWKYYAEKPKVTVVYQDKEKITLSQRNVVEGIVDALRSTGWFEVIECPVSKISTLGTQIGYGVVIAPFAIPIESIQKVRANFKEIMAFHIEDPQALGANLERAKYFDYISTNDISVMELYEAVVGKGNVAFCPSISVNDVQLKFETITDDQKEYDVLFVGYPYASRLKFIRQLDLFRLSGLGYKCAFVGDGWKEELAGVINGNQCFPTLGEQETMRLMEKSRIVLLHNRHNYDCGGSVLSVEPKSVVRGYFEAASGSLVMIDHGRTHHSLKDLCVFYKDHEDVMNMIQRCLKNTNDRVKFAENAKKVALSEFTYRKRFLDVFNFFRSRRFYMEVK
jgi:hypothetical protein